MFKKSFPSSVSLNWSRVLVFSAGILKKFLKDFSLNEMWRKKSKKKNERCEYCERMDMSTFTFDFSNGNFYVILVISSKRFTNEKFMVVCVAIYFPVTQLFMSYTYQLLQFVKDLQEDSLSSFIDELSNRPRNISVYKKRTKEGWKECYGISGVDIYNFLNSGITISDCKSDS